MSVIVSFCTPRGIGSVHAPGIGTARIRQDLTLGDTTTGAAADGEIAYLVNDEDSVVVVAFGSGPDADATEATDATSAGIAVPAGGALVLVTRAGDKVNAKAVS